MDEGQVLLTEKEAVRRLSIGRSTFRTLMDRGSIRPVRIGRSIRFTPEEIERFVRSLEARVER
ncbi:MAG: helix-turn-helix domain-containing protein [Chloroflexi bacterium]|nr:helix-turn-helix domain-containing protein [Chloroflexota bacterium]